MSSSIAVLGNGMLGTDVAELATKLGYEVKVFAFPEWDITREEDIVKAVSSADNIINCAAYTAVDKAESEPELCEEVNAVAVYNLGRVAAELKKYVVHISTDFVFGDDSMQPLSEIDVTNPLSVYGRTKLEGERLLLKTRCRCGIIRVEWTYGRNGNNFISKIIELAGKLDKLKVVGDQVGAPTPTTSIAEAIMCFVRRRTRGVFHYAARGHASRFEVAQRIMELKGIDIPMEPCESTAFKTPARRPLNSRFDCSAIDTRLDFKRPHWEAALKEYLEEL